MKPRPPITQRSHPPIYLPNHPREHHVLQNLSAKSNTNAIADWAVVRNTIGRLSKDTRARSRGRRARTLEATRIGAREREAVLTKRITIDLAEIIADLPGASIGVFELQNWVRTLFVHGAHLDGAAVVGGEVGLRVGTGLGCEGLDGAAGGDASVVFALAADVEVDGECAVVTHVRLTGCSLTVDERGVMRCMIGWGRGREGGDGEVSPGYNSRNDGRGEMHC